MRKAAPCDLYSGSGNPFSKILEPPLWLQNTLNESEMAPNLRRKKIRKSADDHISKDDDDDDDGRPDAPRSRTREDDEVKTTTRLR